MAKLVVHGGYGARNGRFEVVLIGEVLISEMIGLEVARIFSAVTATGVAFRTQVLKRT